VAGREWGQVGHAGARSRRVQRHPGEGPEVADRIVFQQQPVERQSVQRVTLSKARTREIETERALASAAAPGEPAFFSIASGRELSVPTCQRPRYGTAPPHCDLDAQGSWSAADASG